MKEDLQVVMGAKYLMYSERLRSRNLLRRANSANIAMYDKLAIAMVLTFSCSQSPAASASAGGGWNKSDRARCAQYGYGDRGANRCYCDDGVQREPAGAGAPQVSTVDRGSRRLRMTVRRTIGEE